MVKKKTMNILSSRSQKSTSTVNKKAKLMGQLDAPSILQSGNLNIKDHMKASEGVNWNQSDHREKGPDYTGTQNKMSMSYYVKKYGGASSNLHRRAQSQARGRRSSGLDYQVDSILEGTTSNELFKGAEIEVSSMPQTKQQKVVSTKSNKSFHFTKSQIRIHSREGLRSMIQSGDTKTQ